MTFARHVIAELQHNFCLNIFLTLHLLYLSHSEPCPLSRNSAQLLFDIYSSEEPCARKGSNHTYLILSCLSLPPGSTSAQPYIDCLQLHCCVKSLEPCTVAALRVVSVTSALLRTPSHDMALAMTPGTSGMIDMDTMDIDIDMDLGDAPVVDEEFQLEVRKPKMTTT